MTDIVASGDWPGVGAASEVSWLLHEIVDSYCDMAERANMPALHIINEPDRESPRAIYERCNGRVVIYLHTQSARSWSQITYQLAHELNHVQANFAAQRNHGYKWLEEALCELSSWCTLRHLARRWSAAEEVYRRNYAPHLRNYADDTRREQVSDMPDNIPLWLYAKLPELQEDSYRRKDNAIVAAALLPCATPQLWQAVAYLSLWQVPNGTLLADYLDDWRCHCPTPLRPVVTEVMSRLLLSSE